MIQSWMKRHIRLCVIHYFTNFYQVCDSPGLSVTRQGSCKIRYGSADMQFTLQFIVSIESYLNDCLQIYSRATNSHILYKWLILEHIFNSTISQTLSIINIFVVCALTKRQRYVSPSTENKSDMAESRYRPGRYTSHCMNVLWYTYTGTLELPNYFHGIFLWTARVCLIFYGLMLFRNWRFSHNPIRCVWFDF